MRLREGPPPEKGQSLEDACKWARKMSQTKRVRIISNTGRDMGVHIVTPEEQWQWANLYAEYAQRLGDKAAAKDAAKRLREAEAIRSAGEPGDAPEFTETPIPGT